MDELWDFEDPAGTEQKFLALLPEYEANGDSALLVELLTQIARTQGLKWRYDEAHATLDRAEAMLQPDWRRARVRYLLERGRTLNDSKRKDEARRCFVEAWDVANECGEEALAVDAAHMIAIVEEVPGQIEWNEKALAMAKQSADPKARKWRASLLNNLGWTYHDEGEVAKALGMFEEAVVLREEAGNPVTTRIAHWTVARCLRSLGRVEEALAMQQAQYADADANDRVDMYNLEELGECLHALGRVEEAKPWFVRAYVEFAKDPWLVENEPERVARLKSLGV